MRRRFIYTTVILLAMLLAAIVFARNCPSVGIAFTKERREQHRLKNRTVFPTKADFDSRVSLELLLEPGDDRTRWSQSQAATVEGYVVSTGVGKPELTNCYCRRDIHIHIGMRPDSTPREQVVVEITPRLHPVVSSALGNEAESLVGHWVRFEGWMFFDAQHTDESENIAPGREDNWRATAWEIHPITKIEVIR